MYQLNQGGKIVATSNVFTEILRLAIELKQDIEVYHGGKPLTVVRNNYGRLGIQQEGSIKELFLRMLNEVAIHLIRPHGVVLQPWQMMPNDWEAFNLLGKAAYDVVPCFTPEQRNEVLFYQDRQGEDRQGNVIYFMHAEMNRRFGYDHNGPLYGPRRESNSRHDVHVAFALAEGKPVPEQVIAWYRDNPEQRYDLHFLGTLLKWPEYRGRMSAHKLSALLTALRGSDIVLNDDNSTRFIRLMAALPEDVSYTAVDDYLYQQGVVKVEAAPPLSGEKLDPAKAYSPFALQLCKMLGESRKLDHMERANRHRSEGGTLRELERELQVAEMLPEYESLTFPNRFAEAVEKKDVGYLLAYLDTANDMNLTTKKAVREAFGLKLIGLKAADRRKAIFEFCGYNDLQRAEFERAAADQVEAKKNDRELKLVKAKAESNKIRLSESGDVVTLAEYVDRSVKEGYSEVVTRKRGATVEYWLRNPAAGYLRSLKKGDGSLDYALTVCGLPLQKQAA